MGLGIMGAIITVAMIIPARVNDLAGAQDGAASILVAIASRRAWGTGRQLLAYIVRKGQTATGARITTIATRRGTDATGAVRFRRGGAGFQKVRVVFDLGGRRFARGFFVRVVMKRGFCFVRRRRSIIGGGREIEFIGIALRAGERDHLGADNRGRAMHLAEMRQRKLKRCD